MQTESVYAVANEYVYIVVKQAVYAHGVFGVFRAQDAAEQYAKKLADTCRDDHHSYDVMRLSLDNPPPRSYNAFVGHCCDEGMRLESFRRSDGVDLLSKASEENEDAD